jgi:hypothetical protein
MEEIRGIDVKQPARAGVVKEKPGGTLGVYR